MSHLDGCCAILVPVGIADDIRRKQAAEASAKQARGRANQPSLDSLKRALDELGPEIATACRELKIRPDNDSKLRPVWTFNVGKGYLRAEFSRSGSWKFRPPIYGNQSVEQILADWKVTETFSAEEVRKAITFQIEDKVPKRR